MHAGECGPVTNCIEMPFSDDIKERAMDRADYACERCGHPLIMDSAEFRHIRAESEGGSDKLANCAVLCIHCHLAVPDPL
jgi:5-methylcytosine-specific restriction endonuclease McrA